MPRYQNELKSTVLLVNGKYRIFPKGSTNPATNARNDYADILDKDMDDTGVKQFIAAKKIIPFDGHENKLHPTPVASVVMPKAAKVVVETPKVPDLTASITGEPMIKKEEPKVEAAVEEKVEQPAATYQDLGEQKHMSKKERRRAEEAAKAAASSQDEQQQ